MFMNVHSFLLTNIHELFMNVHEQLMIISPGYIILTCSLNVNEIYYLFSR